MENTVTCSIRLSSTVTCRAQKPPATKPRPSSPNRKGRKRAYRPSSRLGTVPFAPHVWPYTAYTPIKGTSTNIRRTVSPSLQPAVLGAKIGTLTKTQPLATTNKSVADTSPPFQIRPGIRLQRTRPTSPLNTSTDI